MPHKTQRETQIMAEVKPHIDTFFRAFGLEVKLLNMQFEEIGADSSECFSQFYGVRGNPNSVLLFSYYNQHQNPNYTPHFLVSYASILATTSREMEELVTSGLMERLKSLSELNGNIPPEYTWQDIARGRGVGGITVTLPIVNYNNLKEWDRLAPYVKKIILTIDDYIVRNPVLSSIPSPTTQ